jgi:prepilin-type N-terminal cleavage/methylation domain-containing protein/prepilin-type processing-associated H-X9-DG protein
MKRRAFTLVELLVVIAIIGMLVALLLPAINAAREAGRRTTCANQFKQLSLACKNHVNEIGWYPTGGWGWDWVGDPNRGFGIAQPGGWTYNILPYLEFHSLHDKGTGSESGDNPSAATLNALTEMNQTIVGIYYCPSRRAAALYPFTGGVPKNANISSGMNVGKCDYAICCGIGIENDPGDDQNFGTGPATYAAGDAQPGPWDPYGVPTDPNYFQSGISYVRSVVTDAQITRGTAHVILLGEKSLDPAHYYDGGDGADNEELFVGQDNDIFRTTYSAPQQDISGVDNQNSFGSAHPGGFNVSAADGSVHFLNYAIASTAAGLTLYQGYGIINSVPPGNQIWDDN